MQDTAMVVKDNRLIEASYKLSEAEQRIMLMAIAWARENVTDELTTDTWIELQARDYISIFSTDMHNAYKQLKVAVRTLASRKLTVEVTDPITGLPAILEADWVTNALYVEKAGIIRINFGSIIVPYIWRLEERFTAYQLKLVKQLSGSYTIRLYELLLQYAPIGDRTFSIEELREILDAQGKAYDRINNFKARVLDYAIDQINDTTDLIVDYEGIKYGRSWVAVKFIIKRKNRKTQKPPVKASQLVISTQKNSLSLAEQSMLKQLAAQTGLAETDLLAQAKQLDHDLFIALDYMLKQNA